MTWGRAVPVIAVAVIFDLFRMFFEQFWFFGPALAAVGCTSLANNAVGTTVANTGGQIIAAGCGAAAGAAGYFGVGFFETFGTVMSIAIGFAGFLVLAFWIFIGNRRIMTQAAWLWMTGGLAIAELPFIGTLPSYTIVLTVLYRKQIKVEKTQYTAWQQEQQRFIIEQRAAQQAYLLEMQDARAQAEEETEADLENEIPDEGLPLAA